MIDNLFREQLPGRTGWLVRLYKALHLTPNGVSVLAFAFACGACACIALGWNLAAIGLWWVGRLADGTDGVYARATGQATRFGAYFDIVLDMAAYGLVILALDSVHPELHTRWIAIVFLYILCIASALALGTEEADQGVAARDDRGLRLGAGLAEGGETGIAYTLFLLFPSQLPWLTSIWIVILGVTIAARTVLARRTLHG